MTLAWPINRVTMLPAPTTVRTLNLEPYPTTHASPSPTFVTTLYCPANMATSRDDSWFTTVATFNLPAIAMPTAPSPTLVTMLASPPKKPANTPSPTTVATFSLPAITAMEVPSPTRVATLNSPSMSATNVPSPTLVATFRRPIITATKVPSPSWLKDCTRPAMIPT